MAVGLYLGSLEAKGVKTAAIRNIFHTYHLFSGAGEAGLGQVWESVVTMGVALGKVAALTKKPTAVT